MNIDLDTFYKGLTDIKMDVASIKNMCLFDQKLVETPLYRRAVAASNRVDELLRTIEKTEECQNGN